MTGLLSLSVGWGVYDYLRQPPTKPSAMITYEGKTEELAQIRLRVQELDAPSWYVAPLGESTPELRDLHTRQMDLEAEVNLYIPSPEVTKYYRAKHTHQSNQQYHFFGAVGIAELLFYSFIGVGGRYCGRNTETDINVISKSRLS